MSDKQIYILLGTSLFISIIVLITVIILDKRKRKRKVIKQKFKGRGNDFWFQSYIFFSKFFITRRYLQRIRRRIEILELSDNWTVSRKTMKFSYVSLGVSGFIFLILLFSSLDFLYLIIVLITIIVIHNQVVSLLVDRLENKLLNQFSDFLGDVRHHYHEHGMIDEAVYDSIEDCKYEMSLHAHKMYEILTSSDPENEIEKYNEAAPNKFFKTFLANCFLVQRFGDKIVEDQSMFLANLNYLKQEVNMDMLKREKLDYLFGSLSIIAIAPIFALKPIEIWGKFNLPELGEYYDNAYGFVVQIFIFLIAILSYQLINRLQRQSEYTPESNTIFSKLLEIKFIAEVIRMVKNKQYNKSLKYSDLMKCIGEHKSVEHFYLKKVSYAVITLIISIFTFFNMHAITKHNILYKSPDLQMQSEDVDLIAEEKILELDRKYILKFSHTNATYQDIEKALLNSGEIEDRRLAGIAGKRIFDKLKKYDCEYFKWWELIISLVLAGLFYQVPYWLMLFRKKVMQMNMEDEVMQFHTIILMLMYIERISVEDILRWMEQFAGIFKSSISKCLNNFESGDIEALEQLKLDEPFDPFTRIAENLEAASDKITIVRAFDQLRLERGYYLEKRKQDNEIIVNKKGAWGKIIAYIPLGAVVLFYLLLPFIMISIKQFISYSDQMGASGI